jgi:type I restriction enzyme M protein
LKAVLTKFATAEDVPDQAMPEEVLDLIAERYSDPESEANAEEQRDETEGEAEDLPADDERRTIAQERLGGLNEALRTAEKKLAESSKSVETLVVQQKLELLSLAKKWGGPKDVLATKLATLKSDHRLAMKELREQIKPAQKALKAELNLLHGQISQARIEVALSSNRGKLELILSDGELVDSLRERWVSAKVAEKLDYPIFMAVSERGGKDNSGNYKYLLDDKGSLVQFPDGHPQEGHFVVDQDLVNLDLTAADLSSANKLAADKLSIAEAFVRFAQDQNFDFWTKK